MELSKLINAIVEAETEEVEELVQKALDAGEEPGKILKQGLIAGMDLVGEKYEKGDLYLPEMLAAALAMKSGVELLKPHLVGAGAEASGVVVIGTVKGDIHDIGKNLVSMMLEGAGFEVIDLGIDVAPQTFVNAVKEHKCQILGLSALLNSTLPAIKETIDALKEAGVRDQVKVMVGGAPVTQSFADEVGADAYGADAAGAVTRAREFAR